MAGKKSATASIMVVMGLLIDSPDTPSGVAARLREDFGAMRFSRSVVYTAANRLKREGLVRVMEGDEKRRAARLCATEQGVESFTEWLYAETSLPLPWRDATRMRLWLCRDLDDLRKRIDEINEEIRTCKDAQSRAHKCLLRAQRGETWRRGQPKRSWRTTLDCELYGDEIAYWVHREQDLYALQNKLQRLHDEFSGT
jgi:DNA-binding PadR family transcriptional regulator